MHERCHRDLRRVASRPVPNQGTERGVDRDPSPRRLRVLPNIDSGADARRRVPDAGWAEARRNILPRLVGPAFVRALPVDDGDAQPYVARLAGELGLALVLREPGRARFVRRRERATWPSDAVRVAIENLARTSRAAKLLHVQGEEGGYVTARSRDGLDAARLLLPGLHELLAPELGSPFVAAVPHRDALFACAADASTCVDALAERARMEHDRARYPISGALYLVRSAARIEPCAR